MAQLRDRISGVSFNVVERIAREVGVSHLYAAKIHQKHWQVVNWDMIGDSVSQVGPIYTTKAELMYNAEKYAKDYGFSDSEIELCAA